MIRCIRFGSVKCPNGFCLNNIILQPSRFQRSQGLSLGKCPEFLQETFYIGNVGTRRTLFTFAYQNSHIIKQIPTRNNCIGTISVRLKNTRQMGNGKDVKANKTTKIIKKRDLSRFLRLAQKERWTLIAGIGCLLVSSAITMSVPFALGHVLDLIFDKDTNVETTTTTTTMKVSDKLRYLCTILCGVFFIGGLANYGRVYLFNSASLRIVRDLRSKLYGSMIRQEVGWFDQKGTGELVNRLATDTYLIGNSLSQNLSDGLRSTVMILAGTGMMVYTSPQLTLISMGVVPMVAGLAIIYGRYVRNITRRLLDKFAEISKEAEERLSNIKTVKIFCKENEEELNYNRLLQNALDLGYKEVNARSIFYGTTGMSGNIIIISVLYYGGMLVMSNSLTIGALTSFILYAGYTAISINGLSNFYTELNKGIGSAQRVWEILDRPQDIIVNNPIRLDDDTNYKTRGQIIFKNVEFSFPTRSDIKVLNGLNLILEAGQTTALVGKSGSGKTTIALLLLRLYELNGGSILIDGMNIQQLTPSWIRSQIGTVSQEPALFSGSIRDNILYGLNPGVKVNELTLNRVIRKAHIREFTDRMPDGLNTLVGQRGTTLSGGQKQRIAIARALIKNPSILILDEATSALDAVSEQLVQNALEELTKGRTCLTIAHRLSTISNADVIAVLDQGRVIEQGTYDQLIQRNDSNFKELVKKQTVSLSV